MARNSRSDQNQVTGWVGWIAFASMLLLLVGLFHALAGFIALFKDDLYVSAAGNVWILDYSQWGWIHIAAGGLAILAAISLGLGRLFGRIVAVIIAMLSAVANMAFIPIYPLWSIIIITIDVLVIWAVMAHGREMARLQR